MHNKQLRAIVISMTENPEKSNGNLSPLFAAQTASAPPPDVPARSVTIGNVFTPDNPGRPFKKTIADYQDVVLLADMKWVLDKERKLYRPDADYTSDINRGTVMVPPASENDLAETMQAALVVLKDGKTLTAWQYGENINKDLEAAETYTLRALERMDPQGAADFARRIVTEPVRLRVMPPGQTDGAIDIILRDFRDIAEMTESELNESNEPATLITLRNGQTFSSPDEAYEIEDWRDGARTRALDKIATFMRNCGPGPQPQLQPQTAPKSDPKPSYTLDD